MMARGFAVNKRTANIRTNKLTGRRGIAQPKYANAFLTKPAFFSTTHSLRDRDAYVKTTTGITGVPVVQDGRSILIQLYKRHLTELEQLPEKDPVKVIQTLLINERLQILESEEDLPTIEAKLNIDSPRKIQIEELIDDIEGDMRALPVYINEIVNQPKDENFEIPVFMVSSQESLSFNDLRNNFYKYAKSPKMLRDWMNGETEVYANSKDQTYPANDKAAKKLF